MSVNKSPSRAGFTLLELLVVITIIGLISAMMSAAMATAQRQALIRRAQGELLTYGTILQARLAGITFTNLTENVSNGFTSGVAGGLGSSGGPAITVQQDRDRARLMLKRDYARMILPNCQADLLLPPASFQRRQFAAGPSRIIQTVAVSNIVPRVWNEMRSLAGLPESAVVQATYQAVAGTTAQPINEAGIDAVNLYYTNSDFKAACYGASTWTPEFESAECLYLILASTRQNGLRAIDNVPERNIGDTDGDGISEILDPWGNPVCFIREPVGLQSSVIKNFDPTRASNPPYAERTSISESVEAFTPIDADPYDLLGSDFRYSVDSGSNPIEAYVPFFTVPVVISAGSDGEFGIYRPEDLPKDSDGLTGITSVSFTLSAPPTPLLTFGGVTMPYRYADPYFDMRRIVSSTVIESGGSTDSFPHIFDARRGAGLGGFIGVANRVGDAGIASNNDIANRVETNAALASDNVTSIDEGL